MSNLLSACQAWTEAKTEADREAVRTRVRTALAHQRNNEAKHEHLVTFDAAIAAASAESTAEDALKRFERIEIPPAGARAELRPIAEWAGQPEPAPVVWRDPGDENDPHTPADPIVSVGEPGLLSGPGGIGKSCVTLQLALAAADAHKAGDADYGSAAGLRVRAGPVILIAYEDSPVRIAARLTRLLKPRQTLSTHIHILPGPAPLYLGAGEDRHATPQPGPQWDPLWEQAERIAPSLMIIDPASEALADVAGSDTGPVRTFLGALCAQTSAIKTGALIVAHDTKAARNAARIGEDPGAGAVAGSSAWYDRARAVLYLTREDGPAGSVRSMRCLKANHGRAGWSIHLAERIESGHFRGFVAHPVAQSGSAPKLSGRV